jgi:hypothetical protein
MCTAQSTRSNRRTSAPTKSLHQRPFKNLIRRATLDLSIIMKYRSQIVARLQGASGYPLPATPARAILIDTLPIRIAVKPFDCIIGARSNRHWSEGHSGAVFFIGTLETSLGRAKRQNSVGRCYNRSLVLRCEAKRLEQVASYGSGIRIRIRIGRGKRDDG